MYDYKLDRRQAPPLFWQVVGHLLRNTPNFTRKGHICEKIIGKFIRGRGYSTIIAFDLGERISLCLDDWIPFLVFVTGQYSVEAIHTEFFRKAVSQGMILLDIGANVGYYTLQAAVRVGRRGQVHAFEPVSETFAQLQYNILLNKFQNIIANRCIVHDHHGIMDIYIGDRSNTGTSSLLPIMGNYSGRVENVEAITIDDYVEEKGLPAVHLVKIDVEGSELSVLRGMKRLLSKYPLQLLIEVTRSALESQGATPRELVEFLQAFGFCTFKLTKTGPVEIHEASIYDDSLYLFRKRSTLGS